MSVNEEDLFNDGEGLDLTSEPQYSTANRFEAPRTSETSNGGLTQVQVHFRCCRVYWRFPIPADVLSGVKDSWFVHCPRCGGKLKLP